MFYSHCRRKQHVSHSPSFCLWEGKLWKPVPRHLQNTQRDVLPCWSCRVSFCSSKPQPWAQPSRVSSSSKSLKRVGGCRKARRVPHLLWPLNKLEHTSSHLSDILLFISSVLTLLPQTWKHRHSKLLMTWFSTPSCPKDTWTTCFFLFFPRPQWRWWPFNIQG